MRREGEREKGKEGGRGEERELKRSSPSRPSGPGILMTLKGEKEKGREGWREGEREGGREKA